MVFPLARSRPDGATYGRDERRHDARQRQPREDGTLADYDFNGQQYQARRHRRGVEETARENPFRERERDRLVCQGRLRIQVVEVGLLPTGSEIMHWKSRM